MSFLIFFGLLVVTMLFLTGIEATSRESAPLVESLVQNNRSRRLVGSKSTVINLFPHHVSLEYRSKHICGGAIVSSYLVLTAASCQVADITNLLVRAGTNWREAGGSLHHVFKFVIHPNFTSILSHGYNIALLKVTRPFEIDDNRKAIEMFRAGEEICPNSVLDITGFSDTSDQLQNIGIPTESCKKNRGQGKETPYTFCAGFTNKNLCFEDTGSPVTINFRLAGIVSHAINCERNPAVITEVSLFRDWISSLSISNI